MAKAAAHYLFIDGGCLRATLEREAAKYVSLDKCGFDLRRVANGYTKVFLYDAVPARQEHESEAEYQARIKSQQEMLDGAAQVHGVHVYEGTAHRRNKRLEQKKVDVMIAVDMLTHTFRRNMDYATLLTGDGDFHPLVDALVHEGMFVNLWYPPAHTSKDLLRAADARRPITIDEIFTFLDPDTAASIHLPNVATVMTNGFAVKRTRIHNWIEGGKSIEMAYDGQNYILSRQENPVHTLTIYDEDHNLVGRYAEDRFGIHVPFFEPHPNWKR
jgi:uncharacterized LabA/DUF88 family protein